ncbi:MAG: helix-hairpin-helix domain-containing protein [Actinobacteria bacterium]|nr:helix-hairpin-helix domain-containing protein [Actinomycetota bacterium]
MPTVEERIRALWSTRTDDESEYVPASYTFSTSSSTRRTLVKFMLAAISTTGLFLWLNRPQIQVTPKIVVSGTPIAAAPIAVTSTNIVIDVEGKVHFPGLRTLPSDARVADAIAAAGGTLHGVPKGTVNLAARLSDGQLLIVGQVAGAGVASGDQGNSSQTNQISLNSATESDFESLPGVGPVLANRILTWRTQHGSFSSIEDLQNVPGIGPKVFANLSSYVTL